MYLLGVVCLLSAAVALPTPEQLHTNLPAPPPPPQLKSEEKDISSDEKIVEDPVPSSLEEPESEDDKNRSESAEKHKEETAEDREKLDDVSKVIQKESKESKEPKDSKEKSKESKESKESWDTKEHEEIPDNFMDSKSEESKEKEEVGPVIVQIVHKPSQKGYISDWFPLNFHLPWPFSLITSKFRNGGQRDQPIYIVGESDLAFDDWH